MCPENNMQLSKKKKKKTCKSKGTAWKDGTPDGSGEGFLKLLSDGGWWRC